MNFPGKNTGMGCHSLLQEIYPIQGLNQSLPYCRQVLYWCHSNVCKEKEMATLSSTLAWKFHGWRSLVGYSHGRLQFTKSQTRLSNFTFFLSIVLFGEGNGNLRQCSQPGESRGQRGLVAYRLWGWREPDTTKQLTHTHTHKCLQPLLIHSFKQSLMHTISGHEHLYMHVVGVISTVDAVTRKVGMLSIKNLKFHKISLFACSGFYN